MPIEYFGISFQERKPTIPETSQYYRSRVIEDPLKPLFPLRSKGHRGNLVITSQRSSEPTFAGVIPAQLMASKEGETLIRKYPGLIKQIMTGQVAGEELPDQGREGTVYKISLPGQDLVVKNTFAIEVDKGIHSKLAYTPGTLQMDLLQTAASESSLPDVNWVVPILATNDLTITPYIPNSVQTHVLDDWIKGLNWWKLSDDYYKYRNTLTSSFTDHGISKTDGDTIRNIMSKDWGRRDFYQAFLSTFHKAGDNMKKWCDNLIEKDPNLIAHRLHEDQPIFGNSIISIP